MRECKGRGRFLSSTGNHCGFRGGAKQGCSESATANRGAAQQRNSGERRPGRCKGYGLSNLAQKGKGGALVLTESSAWPEKERSVDGDADRRRGGSRARWRGRYGVLQALDLPEGVRAGPARVVQSRISPVVTGGDELKRNRGSPAWRSTAELDGGGARVYGGDCEARCGRTGSRAVFKGGGRGSWACVQGDARSGPGRVRVRQAERARVEAGAGWAETEEGGEWAAARVGPTWAAEMGWWVWVLGSFPFLILFSLSSISNSNKV